jgi:hypothetical protein
MIRTVSELRAVCDDKAWQVTVLPLGLGMA